MEDRETAEHLKDLNKTIELDPKNYLAILERGLIYQERGEIEKCLQDYTQAIEAAKSNKDFAFKPYDYRAEAYMTFGMYEKALDDYKTALSLAGTEFFNPAHSLNAYRIFLFRGHTYMKMGKYKEAAEDYTNAIAWELRPQLKLSAYTFIKRAAAFEKLEEILHAKEDYEMALSLSPKEPEAALAKERLTAINKQIEEVMEDQKRVRL